jgi:hypothetical protein
MASVASSEQTNKKADPALLMANSMVPIEQQRASGDCEGRPNRKNDELLVSAL